MFVAHAAKRTPPLKSSDVPPQPPPSVAADEAPLREPVKLPYEPGQEIKGTKHIALEAIGLGNASAVYMAQHVRLNLVKRAIKFIIFHPTDTDDDKAARAANLDYEAQILSELVHPNIIAVIDVGITEDELRLPYFTMEEGSARSLHKIVNSAKESRVEGQSVLQVIEIFQIAIEASDAIAYVHSQDIVHCDIKLDNIILQEKKDLSDRYVVKVIDFNLARHLDENGTAPHVYGTALFAPPEQHEPPQPATRNPISPASDVYSLGQTFYMMITGEAPYQFMIQDCKSDQEVFATLRRAHTDKEIHPVHLRNVARDIPVKLADVVMEMIEKDPKKRPTAVRVASRIREILSEYEKAQRNRISSSSVECTTDQSTVTGAFRAQIVDDVRGERSKARGPRGTERLLPKPRRERETPNMSARRTVDCINPDSNNQTDVDADLWWLEEEQERREAERRAAVALVANNPTRTIPPAQGATKRTPYLVTLKSAGMSPVAVRIATKARDVGKRVGQWWHRPKEAVEIVYLDPDEALRLADTSMRTRQARRRMFNFAMNAVLTVTLAAGVLYLAADVLFDRGVVDGLLSKIAPSVPSLVEDAPLVIERDPIMAAARLASDAPAERETATGELHRSNHVRAIGFLSER